MRQQDTRPAFGRRRFVTGVAALAAAGGWRPARAGSSATLTIGEVGVNITGQPRTAIGIDGSMPGPVLRWRQGETVRLTVANRLAVPTSLHWHGVRVPSGMDGVPGFSFGGIPPGGSYEYLLPIRQSGTYWYHSHSGLQEQSGLAGAIVIAPAGGEPHPYDRDHVVLLSDWADVAPERILATLKSDPDYYARHRPTLAGLAREAETEGLLPALRRRLAWERMNMSPGDILDVSGAVYTYLVNGRPPAVNETFGFAAGERVRLRFINASSMTIFDVRIPGLALQVVQADGNDVEPVTVDSFRIGAAETYDVIVRPVADAYTIFAEAEDRTGYARATLARAPGLRAAVPGYDPVPQRTMADMGMRMAAMDGAGMSMSGMDMKGMDGEGGPPAGARVATGVEVDNVAAAPTHDLAAPGAGAGAGRHLTYADLRALRDGADARDAARTIVLHLTGNMGRYIWGFDGRKYSEAKPIELRLGERVRFTLINDSMMEHPMHLHGLWSELENGQGARRPYKHTILVRPAEQVSFLVSADTPGRWAFHCHLLYHMELGMFREVRVS